MNVSSRPFEVNSGAKFNELISDNAVRKQNNMRANRVLHKLTIISILYVTLICRAKIMRNNALMNKMMSQFHKDNSNNLSMEPAMVQQTQPKNVITLMQDVLCRNFPTIPCTVIMQDETLRRLIQKSIQQINNRKLSMERTTQAHVYKTNFPIVNSEDLSNFLEVQNTGYFDNREHKHETKKHKQVNVDKVKWSQENLKSAKKLKNIQRTSMYGRKKLRKFYPHKVKYKDKKAKNKPEYKDYSDEKLSMSVEIPDMTLTKKHQHYSYKMEPADPPVWRIDYTKHGDPSYNILGSITKTGSNRVVDDKELEKSARKDVMHPDVYIKTNFIRKNSELID
ncbi:unnamed protein product [Parnassius apollo]|uniref:(apollo) hypothetical protein n=1 Tax=Parnassius apollo TaxID=110799 RepID=A0A8S3X9K1_PARAO|nr:unnamed protein product [Parnassius apollo]